MLGTGMDPAQARNRAPHASFLTFFILVIISLIFMVFDHKTSQLQGVRSVLTYLVYPFQVAGALPGKLGNAAANTFADQAQLKKLAEQLAKENLILRARLQQFDSMQVENERLRKLFGAAKRVGNEFLMAELLEVSLEPFNQRIIIDKGSVHGVYVGQSVIDANGVMGQVTQVYPLTSAVTLITDPSHAIPVEVQRNGLRTVLFGTGSATNLEVRHLNKLADIQEGDVLVTSGLGGRFPSGFPVAKVVSKEDTGEAFLSIQARPSADLNRSKEVLLIWQRKQQQAALATEADQ